MGRNKHPEEQIYKDFCQEFVFRWPKLVKYLFRFEHGGYVIGYAERKARKRTLLKAGIPDYGLFYAIEPHTMLWIEFKVKPNRLTPKQEEVRDILISQGSKYVCCYSAEEGIEEVKKYLE